MIEKDPDRADNKKRQEEEQLSYFLEIYERITGMNLEVLSISERPDFICQRSDGQCVGIELTEVTRGDPETKFWEMILCGKEAMDSDLAIETIQSLGINKERKRSQDDWQLPDNTVLLFLLTDIPLSDLVPLLNRQFLPDLVSSGFSEVWFCDYTGIDAFGDIEAFCLFPERWFGYYSRPFQKPYG